MKAVIDQLCDFFPDFKLYFATHFEFTKRTSLTPHISSDGMPSFPEDYRIRRKKLTEEDKRAYYRLDMALWEVIQDE